MAYAVLGARPNSHPFVERNVVLSEPIKIGRAVAKCKPATNNLIFDCKVLSRSHAIIWHQGGKFFIQDTKSSNGTYVNSVQVGRGAEDSEGVEIKSGDVLQFGVDVTENSKKVTHGCIIATVTLIHPDGTEALGEADNVSSRILPFMDVDKSIKAQELWQLSKYLQDALNKEQMLEQKLATMQRMIANSSAASEGAFQAFVKEDELLSRLDILENELDIISKESTPENCNKVLIEFQEEKESYEKKTKETIERLLQEKVDALRKLADAQRSLSYSEDECSQVRCLYDKSEEDVRGLMERHEQCLKELQHLKEQLDAATMLQNLREDEIEDERKILKNMIEEAEKRGSTLAVQIESLQAECDFTKKQLFAVKEKLEEKLVEKQENCFATAGNVTFPTGQHQNLLTNLQDSLRHMKECSQVIARNLNIDLVSLDLAPFINNISGNVRDATDVDLLPKVSDQVQVENDQDQAESDQDQAESDQEQVESDQDQVESDQEQVESDPEQVESDPERVESDPERVESDPERVESDPEQVESDQDQVESDRDQVENDRDKVEDNHYKTESQEDGIQNQEDPIDNHQDQLLDCCRQADIIRESLKQLSESCASSRAGQAFGNDNLQGTESEVNRLHEEIILLNDTISEEQNACRHYKELAVTFEDQLSKLKHQIDSREDLQNTSENGEKSPNSPEKNLTSKERIKQLENELEKLKHNQNSEEFREEASHQEEEFINKDVPNLSTNYQQTTNQDCSQNSDNTVSAHANNSTKPKAADTQGIKMFQVLLALVALFIAIGAAILLDVVKVSFGNSPIFDSRIWTELYENLF